MCLSDKSRIVEEGNYHKFTKAKGGPEKMMRMLLDTGDRELVEVRPVLSPFSLIQLSRSLHRQARQTVFGEWDLGRPMQAKTENSGVRIVSGRP